MPAPNENPKWSTLSYEVALTVTLPASARKLTADEQISKYLGAYMSVMDRYCKHTSLIELTQNYDVHWHAICQIRDLPTGALPMKFLVDKFKKTDLGMVKAYQVWDQGWETYLFKDVDKTNLMINRSAVVKDDYGKYNPWLKFLQQPTIEGRQTPPQDLC